MQEKVTGIVLHSSPMGEYDKRLVILTVECGKVVAFAKGARRPKSSLSACSQVFTFAEFSMFRGSNSNTVSSAVGKNYFAYLREDLEGIYYGCYFCEVMDYYTKENLDAKEELTLLYQTLRALGIPSLNRELIRYIFELKLLTINGEAPNVFQCRQCGKEPDSASFYWEDAEIACSECITEGKHIDLSETALYTMRRIITEKTAHLYTFNVSERVRMELKTAISKYFDSRCDGCFRSKEMLK